MPLPLTIRAYGQRYVRAAADEDAEQADWIARIRRRNRRLFQQQPELKQLEAKLLQLGGKLVPFPVPRPGYLSEPYAKKLLARGYAQPGAPARYQRGQANSCHSNAARLWASNPRRYAIESGYALSRDGGWREHSWIYDLKDRQIIESTEKRVKYFGFRLTDPEAKTFYRQNAQMGL